jgi:hypothetical protein
MLGLDQAYKATGTDLEEYRGQIDDFVVSNKRFISSESEVIDGFAKLTRAGLTQKEVQNDMSRAVDLAALKHISLTEAVGLLIKAEQGRMKGLIDLGVTTGKYTDSQGNLIHGSKDVRIAMEELDAKIKDGRQSISEEDQATNSMGITWQKFALGPGKEFHRSITNALQISDLFLQMLDKMGSNNPAWDSIQNSLIKTGNAMKKWYRENSNDGGVTLLGPDYSQYGPGATAGGKGRQDGRASGGPVIPGGVYTVGENGPETLVMGASGGNVIPNSGQGGGADMRIVAALLRETNGLLRDMGKQPSGQTGVEAALYRAVTGAALNRARGGAGA